mmetsp:Transcript_35796/g.78150  ORF Transcript_35796/g.78150 Transcript_35796/m.78150 type:complete len:240 (+) Transcript_35796:788-1507(+)
MHTVLNVAKLRALRGTAVNASGLDARATSKLLGLRLDLAGQLTRGSEHHDRRALTGILLCGADVQKAWKHVTERLSTPSLGNRHNITSGDRHSPGLGLDRCGSGESCACDLTHYVGGDRRVLERHEGIGAVAPLHRHIVLLAILIYLRTPAWHAFLVCTRRLVVAPVHPVARIEGRHRRAALRKGPSPKLRCRRSHGLCLGLHLLGRHLGPGRLHWRRGSTRSIISSDVGGRIPIVCQP